MSNVTAKQLAEVIGISVEKLIDQLNAAGIQVSGEDAPISDDEKMKLTFIRLKKSGTGTT